MRNLFIIDGIVAAGSSVTTTLTALTTRKVAIIGDGSLVIDNTTTAAELTGIKSVQFVTRLTSGQLRYSVPVQRQSLNYNNYQLYSAPQNKIVQLGTGVALGALVIPSEGEVNFSIQNLSYNHAIATQRINYSATKKSTETPEAFIDRVVTGLNNANALQVSPIVTVVKLGSGANLGIEFTTANEFIDLFIGVDGILSDNPLVTTQEAKVSTGRGQDVVNYEYNSSQFLGNQGYDTIDFWYTQTPESKTTENYNILTLGFEGISPTPTNSIKVANNSLAFALPTAAVATNFIAAINLVFGTAFAASGGAESGDTIDTNDIDNSNANS